jgi:hypothetical protein
MAVSQAVRQEIHQRANGRCECTMTVCGHRGRCTTGLHSPHWDAHRRNANGPDTAGNLTAMCATCHKNTRTYGRS